MTTEAGRTIEQLLHGEHVCLLYEDQAEHLAALIRFHRSGLAGGSRCIQIADAALTRATLEALRESGVDVDGETKRGAFLALAPEDLYLNQGAFEPESVLAFWRETHEEALRAGFTGLHVSGDVTWLLDSADAPGLDRFGEYEVEVNKAIGESRMRALCCYNRQLLPTEVLAHMFRAHPRVIFGEKVLQPDLLVHTPRDGTPAEDWLEVFLDQLRQSEDALRDALGVKEKLFEVVPAAIYTCDPDGLITSFNQTAAQLWGREPKLGDPTERFCGSLRLYRPEGPPLPHDETPIAAALRDGRVYKGVEVLIERPDGSRVTALAHIAPIKDAQGKVTGAVNCLVDITARKLIESMLRQRTEEYYRLLENLPAAAYTCDAEGLITYFNPHAVQVWGREPKLNDPEDRFCGSFKLFLPDESPIRHDQCWMALALQTGEAQHGREIIIERPDGARVIALAHAHPFHNEEGKRVGAVNVLVDITDRKRMENALRKSEGELTDFVETATIGLHRVGSDGVIQWANRAELQMLGYMPDEYIGHHIAEFHADQETVRTLLSRLHEGGQVRDFEAVLRAKDGTLRHVLIDSTVLWENGEFKHTRCFTRDVTDGKQAEEARIALTGQLATELADARRLQEISTRLIQTDDADALNDQLLDAAIGIMRSDMASMQMLCPERGELQLLAGRGFDPAEAKFWEWVRPDSGTSCAEAWRTGQRVVVPDVETCEFMVGTRDLEIYRQAGIRAMQTTPLLSRSGRMLGMISTHWRQPHQPTERELRVFDVLARQAADLIERNQAEEALREADRRKDEFLAMLSHELRNPLAPIRNAVDLLGLDEDCADTRKEALDALQHQTDQLTHIVNDLLDVSRVTTGKIELQRADVDLNELMRRTGDSFRSLMTERKHRFTVSLSGTPLWVNGDATRLEQVVVNLLSNAAKYTPEGGQVWLTIQGGRAEAVIRVRDTGMGIEPELLPRVFELFSQGSRGLDRRSGGLGLGLSLVKSLAEMHGGTVTAASEGPGKGSEFTVRLPLVTPAPRGQSPQSPPEGEQPAAGHLRILVVDDNLDAANIMAKLLGRRGYDVQTAYDGPAAVQAVLDSRPDVVLLDVGLPGMDGYEVARRIRKEEDGRAPVLVAMTGYGRAEDMRRSREAGFDHHLVKPADISALQGILVQVARAQAQPR